MNRNRANRTGNIKKATAFTLSAAMLLGSTGVTAFAADSYASIEKDSWAKKVTEIGSS